ncbi:TetR/AcrR family transcriptional regulator [Cryobacterium sinapicolor]|uniref:TetR/AcrR family transcriptional regulator n=1 Tax=Cryobacterium sinapicolor TaxID=1259236 RepID=A0ABY2J2D9_9MICO|nr:MULTISPECIES: TetR/AcrR family transcriptional regulator [Cryobacterium]TFC85035.1 TetR/AcrR family transcriptional regulator [Cryobacterium sp. TMT3-29-2]TFC97709.1 TetR/AcrR family transcriptional regulator [Cryobacterium sinapicolor]
MVDLSERRHAKTKADIVTAALAMFERDGYSRVTMEDIARVAGVSRRTVYRRFPTKDHIVLEVPKRWLSAWDGVVAGSPDAPPRAVAEAAALAVARYIDDHIAEVLVAYTAIDQSLALVTASAAANREWVERIVGLVRREPGRLAPAMQHVIAGAYLGAIDAMMAQWVVGGGRGSVLGTTKALLERLAPIWPSAADQP